MESIVIDNISVVIITKNASETLEATLDSIKAFSDVVIYDNGSNDNTLEIISAYPNVTLYQGDFLGFGPTKQKAVSLAKWDWVLSIDADECVSEQLVLELSKWQGNDPCVVGIILRDNYFLGSKVKYSGWGNDWLIRLFNRQTHNFNDAMVHENIDLNGKSKKSKLKGVISHAAVTDVGQFLTKINRYSEIRSKTIKKKLHPSVIVIKSLFAFFRTYVLRAGMLDGTAGLVISFSNANGVFWKNIKRYYRKNES